MLRNVAEIRAVMEEHALKASACTSVCATRDGREGTVIEVSFCNFEVLETF